MRVAARQADGNSPGQSKGQDDREGDAEQRLQPADPIRNPTDIQ
jgi:hypothetical protein